MKHPSPIDENSRFSGHLRHYHRTGAQSHRTWEEWIDGKPGVAAKSAKWLKIGAVAAALLALGGIIAGLIIELG